LSNTSSRSPDWPFSQTSRAFAALSGSVSVDTALVSAMSANWLTTWVRDSADTQPTKGHGASSASWAKALASWDFPTPRMPVSAQIVATPPSPKALRSPAISSRATKPAARRGRDPAMMGRKANSPMTACSIM
jgi:hypothetical protein